MNTLDIKQAADLMKMHPMTLRRMASEGKLPAARAGKAWIFIEEDLVNWLRRQYAADARAAGSQGDTTCPSTDVHNPQVPATGADSPVLTADKYADLRARRAELMRSDSSDS